MESIFSASGDNREVFLKMIESNRKTLQWSCLSDMKLEHIRLGMHLCEGDLNVQL